MPASTRVRVAIVAAALAGALAGYAWWNSPERQIHRLLAEIASALSHDGAETGVRALAAVRALQPHFTLDVSIDAGDSSRRLSGREELLATAARLRASNEMIRVRFFDADIDFTDDASAATIVTVQVNRRDGTGVEVADAYLAAIALVRAGGRWMVSGARLLERQETSL